MERRTVFRLTELKMETDDNAAIERGQRQEERGGEGTAEGKEKR